MPRTTNLDELPSIDLDELPNAADAADFIDIDGTVVPALGKDGVEAMRRIFADRAISPRILTLA